MYTAIALWRLAPAISRKGKPQLMSDDQAGAEWPRTIYRLLKEAKVTQVTFVPDGGHKHLIQHCMDDPEMRTVSLTTEQDGIGMATGAWLGGKRSVLLMQSSGLGNFSDWALHRRRRRSYLVRRLRGA